MLHQDVKKKQAEVLQKCYKFSRKQGEKINEIVLYPITV